MKATILALAVLMSMSAFAQSNPVLKADMQQIGTLFTDIYNNMSDPTASAQCAADAGQLASIFGDAYNVVPATISNLPAAQQAAALTNYKSIIEDEITNANNLQKAFLKGDLTTAQTIFTKMNQDKNQGHQAYKGSAPAK